MEKTIDELKQEWREQVAKLQQTLANLAAGDKNFRSVPTTSDAITKPYRRVA